MGEMMMVPQQCVECHLVDPHHLCSQMGGLQMQIWHLKSLTSKEEMQRLCLRQFERWSCQQLWMPLGVVWCESAEIANHNGLKLWLVSHTAPVFPVPLVRLAGPIQIQNRGYTFLVTQ